MKQKLIFLVGPTASGKTAIGISLAKKLNAQIISCDSMQVYKGMEIITSMPGIRQRSGVVHHLLGTVPVSSSFNARQYRVAALSCIEGILKKGQVPLFVGGTGLYVSVLIDGLFCAKGSARVRSRLEKEACEEGCAGLYRRLTENDPQAASKIHPNDARRIIRALEVFEVTGTPISQLQKKRKGITDRYNVRVFCLDVDRQELYRRIDSRVIGMFRKGLCREVQKLIRKGMSKTSRAAIGVRELDGYFNHEYGLDRAKELIARNSRHYAKRQLTWFRKDKRIEWVKVHANDTPAAVALRIKRLI